MDPRADVCATRDLPNTPNGRAWPHLYAAATDQGLGAILTGEGGDQWFDGSARYPLELLRAGSLAGAWRVSKSMSPNQTPLAATYHRAVRPALGIAARRLHLRRRTRSVLPEMFTTSFIQRTGLAERLDQGSVQPTSSTTDRAATVESGWEALAHELQATVAVQQGVALRHPYYDARLVAFALGLDERQRWADGQTRTIQRRALKAVLPDVVRNRTSKAEFSSLFSQTFAALGGRDRFADLLKPSALGSTHASSVPRSGRTG
jgi:asparagine synthase (glutamine-hydrolysing)